MLKKFFSIAAVALLFAACEIVEVDVEPALGLDSGVFTVGASFENNLTKSDINDDGVFTWSVEDTIWVYSDTHKWNKLTIVQGMDGYGLGPRFGSAKFSTGAFQGRHISTAAVFPTAVKPTLEDSKLYLTLPKAISWNDATLKDDPEIRTMQADNIMVDTDVLTSDTNLQFLNVGGLFRLTLLNVPAGANKLKFIADKKINGTFEVVTDVHDYPVINTSESYEEGEDQITINFVNTESSDMTFFIPVPVGSYKIGFIVEGGSEPWEFHSTVSNEVKRAVVKKMPAVTNMSIGGGGESSSNIIVTPTGFSGSLNLPNTTSNIYVQMNETAGTISLIYSSGSEHPANVYLQALGTIHALNVNLPNSHVELTGTSGQNITIDNVSSHTNVSTLVIHDSIEISNVTVTGGSLELNAPVAGTVKVEIPDEHVNNSDKKVSIEINSEINNLEVKTAATKDNPDKIYVTLGSVSKVKETLSVPEVNCNLYIAPGAQAKIVETSAETTCIEGEVTTLNVTGETTTISGTVGTINAATSSTEGAPAPTVTVTSDATVNGAISAAGGAEIFIESGATANGNKSTDEGQGSSIIVLDETKVARIGSTVYPSLAAAISDANATGNVTITLLKDYDFEANEPGYGYTTSYLAKDEATTRNNMIVFSGNNIIFDLGGHTISNLFNNTFKVAGTNITFQNGGMRVGQLYYSNDTGSQVYTSENDKTCSYIVYVSEATNFTVNDLTTYGGINVSASTATINNLAFSGTKFYAVCSQDNAIVTLNGGTYTKAITGATGNLFWVESGSIMNITGGTYIKGNAAFRTGINPVITGGSFDFDPTTFGVASGYEATQTGSNVWTVGPVTGVVAIGQDGYASLAEAIEAAANGQTIKILKNFTIEGNAGVTIPAGKSITIDLNGKNIKNRVTEDAQSQLILNNGTLTITDSSNNPGTMSNEIANGVNPGSWTSHNYSTSIIYNTGTVTVEKGTIREVAGGGSANICFAIDNVGANTSLTVNGGTLEAGYIPVRSYIGQNKTVAIHGGTLTGLYDIYLQSATTLNIDGGSFNAPTRTIMYVEGVSSVDISGDAVFNYASDRQFIAFDNDSAESGSTVSVTGGTYSSDPSTYVSAGYGAFQSGNVWTVQQLTASNAAAQIGSTFYATLPAAFNAAQNGDTITVLSNTDLPATINVAKQVTLDLNSKTLSNTADLWAGGNWSFFSVKAGGNLTVTGNGTIDAKENDCYTFDVQNGGSLTIKNGTFTGNISCVYLINKAETGISTCNIEGGHFSIKQLDKSDPYHLLLNSLDADYTAGLTNFVVTGGSFEHFNPAASTSEPGSPVSFVPDGYYATEENDIWTVLEETNVAQIDDTKYATLAEAIAAVPDNAETTITMIGDDTIMGNAGITITSSKRIILDLNGHTVKNAVNENKASQVFNNYGVFKIIDTKGGGVLKNGIEEGTQPGEWWSTPQYNYATNVVNNLGTLTIDGAKLHQTASGSICYAVDNNSTSYDVTLNLVSGILTSERTVVRQFCNSAVKNNTVNISGGEITTEGKAGLWIHLPGSDANSMKRATLNISGGTLRASNYAFYDYSFGDGWDNVHYSVTGGTFIGSVESAKNIGDSGHKFISGGTFSEDPTLYVADGYGAIYTSGTCPYQVTNLNWANYAASDADFTAATNGTTISINSAALLAKFAKNVNSGVTYKGYTIELTADIDLAGKIWTPIGIAVSNGDGAHRKTFEGTFDGKGYSISNLNCSSNENKPLGLFGVTYGGPSYIQNLTMSNVFVSGVHQAGAIIGNGNNVNISQCSVNGGRVVSVPLGNDNGNQAGGIAGYLFAADWHTNGHITGCAVNNLTVKAYRDVGGVVGAMQNSTDHNSNPDVGAVYVQNNTVENCTVIADQSVLYCETKPFNAGQIVGRLISGTADNNTAANVTIQTIPYAN